MMVGVRQFEQKNVEPVKILFPYGCKGITIITRRSKFSIALPYGGGLRYCRNIGMWSKMLEGAVSVRPRTVVSYYPDDAGLPLVGKSCKSEIRCCIVFCLKIGGIGLEGME